MIEIALFGWRGRTCGYRWDDRKTNLYNAEVIIFTVVFDFDDVSLCEGWNEKVKEFCLQSGGVCFRVWSECDLSLTLREDWQCRGKHLCEVERARILLFGELPISLLQIDFLQSKATASSRLSEEQRAIPKREDNSFLLQLWIQARHSEFLIQGSWDWIIQKAFLVRLKMKGKTIGQSILSLAKAVNHCFRLTKLIQRRSREDNLKELGNSLQFTFSSSLQLWFFKEGNWTTTESLFKCSAWHWLVPEKVLHLDEKRREPHHCWSDK